jgi:Zn-dependent protease
MAVHRRPGATAQPDVWRRHAAERSEGLFSSTFRLGRIAGIEIGLNWSWLPVFGLFVWSLAGIQFPADLPGRSPAAYAAMGIVATILFFVSLLLHELGHALQAIREGVRIEGITLWLFGGVAKIDGEVPSAGAEFRITIAGPLVTAALAAVFWLSSAVWRQDSAPHQVLLWLGYINTTLLVFNLVPAIPLDGGRVLRAALWARTRNFVRATHWAARVSAALATLMIILGAFVALTGAFGGVWLAVLGWFILEASRAEEGQATVRAALSDAPVATLMTRDPITVPAGMTLAQMAAALAGTPRHTAYPVVVAGGRVLGLMPLRCLAEHPPADWALRTVDECLVPISEIPLFTPDTPAQEALDELVRSGVGRGLVVQDGRLTGILSITDLIRALDFGRPV